MQRVRWLAVSFVAAGLFVLMVIPPSTAPAPEVQTPLIRLDKWLHLADFAVLAFTLGSALQARPLVHAWVSASLYGVALELLQWGIPYRAFSLGDIAADVVGTGIGVGLWYSMVVLERWRRA